MTVQENKMARWSISVRNFLQSLIAKVRITKSKEKDNEQRVKNDKWSAVWKMRKKKRKKGLWHLTMIGSSTTC